MMKNLADDESPSFRNAMVIIQIMCLMSRYIRGFFTKNIFLECFGQAFDGISGWMQSCRNEMDTTYSQFHR